MVPAGERGGAWWGCLHHHGSHRHACCPRRAWHWAHCAPLLRRAALARGRQEDAHLLCELPAALSLDGDAGCIGRAVVRGDPPVFELDLKGAASGWAVRILGLQGSSGSRWARHQLVCSSQDAVGIGGAGLASRPPAQPAGILYSAELAPLAGTAMLLRTNQAGTELALEHVFPTLLRCQPSEDFLERRVFFFFFFFSPPGCGARPVQPTPRSTTSLPLSHSLTRVLAATQTCLLAWNWGARAGATRTAVARRSTASAAAGQASTAGPTRQQAAAPRRRQRASRGAAPSLPRRCRWGRRRRAASEGRQGVREGRAEEMQQGVRARGKATSSAWQCKDGTERAWSSKAEGARLGRRGARGGWPPAAQAQKMGPSPSPSPPSS